MPSLTMVSFGEDLDSFAVVFGKCDVKHAQPTTKLDRGMGSELVFSSRHCAVTLNYLCGFGAGRRRYEPCYRSQSNSVPPWN